MTTFTRVGCCFALIVAALAPAHRASAQAAGASQAGAVLAGVVVDSASGLPLPYSTVSIRGTAAERFTSASGTFAFTELPNGAISIVVRHIGYAPRSITLELGTGEPRALRIALSPVAVPLAPVMVRVSSKCTAPGAPRTDAGPAFAATFEQLLVNAAQYHLLATTYPFVASYERTISAQMHDRSLVEQRHDTIVIRSNQAWRYAPGTVIGRSLDARVGSAYVLHIPTLETFADSTFIAAHCFSYGGLDSVAGHPLLRIDFRASARINTPDVDGAMFLDPKTLEIRRTEIRLSRPPRQLPDIRSTEVTTTFDDLLPSIPVITDISSRNSLSDPAAIDKPRAILETQTEIALAFERGHPGQSPTIVAVSASAAHVGSHGTHAVQVLDSATGRPVAGVEVHDPISDSSTYTAANGRAAVNFMPDSGGLLVLRKIGYGIRAIRVRGVTDDTVPIRATLTHVVELDPVVVRDAARPYVSPLLRGFDERRRHHVTGYFIDDSTLRHEDYRKLGDILRSRAAAVIADGSHSSMLLLKSPRCSDGGPPQVYLDGVPLTAPPLPGVKLPSNGRPATQQQARNGLTPPFDLSAFNVSDLAGVEYYPDGNGLPAEFSQTSLRCGALLLWTRER
jgi:carboxypeptidase family protein